MNPIPGHRVARAWRAGVAMLFALIASASHAQVDPAAQAGAAWLQSRVQANGALAGEAASQALPLQQRAEALQTITLVTGSAPSALADRVAAESRAEVEFAARQADALAIAGRDAAPFLARVKAAGVPSGGFGAAPGVPANLLDTTLALLTLRHDLALDAATLSKALAYLNAAVPSGGFGVYGQSRVYVTAYAIVAADAWKSRFDVASITTPATTWLLAQRQAGSFANSTENAIALLALATQQADPATITPIADALRAAQSPSGSWNDDNFVTALATRALWRLTQAPPEPTTGAVAGRVMHATLVTPVADATVLVVERPESAATTDSDGRFSIGALPPGSYHLRVAAIGFTPREIAYSVAAGQVAQLGDIALAPAALTARLSGVVRDNNGNPVADALVAVGTATTSTGATGAYSIDGLQAGPATITVTKSGYYTVTGTATFVAGGQYVFSPSLTPTWQQPPTDATLKGRVVNAATSAAIAGATITVGAVTATSAADGRFSLASLPVGAFSVSITATGYGAVTATGTLAAGTNDIGDVRLATVPTQSTLTGIVRDIDTGAPVEGAVVAVQMASITSTTDATGRYTLAGLTNTAFQLLVTKAGYNDARFDVTLPQHGEHTLDLTIATATTGETGITFREVTTSLPEYGPYDEFEIEVEAQNTTGDATELVVDARVLDPSGQVAFELKANAHGLGQNPPNLPIAIPGNAIVEIEMERILLRQPAGRYTVLARGYDATGRVVAQGTTQFDVRAEKRFGGAVTIDPPLAQAGTGQPVHITAGLTNVGNLPIPAGDYELKVTLQAADDQTSQQAITAVRTAFAGTPLEYPRGATADAQGNVYIANNAGRIVRIAPDDTPTIVATITGTPLLVDVARAADGTLYAVNPYGNRVWQVSPAGVQTEFTIAALGGINGITLDTNGDLLLVGPSGNEHRLVRRTPAGVETILVSNGLADPVGVAVAPDGQLVVANQRDGTLSKLDAAGVVRPYLSGFAAPYGLVYQADGSLLVGNAGNGTISRIASDGTRSTYATGLSDPGDLALAPNGDLYVANRGDATLRRVLPNGTVQLFARGISNGPQDLQLEPDGSLLIGNDDGTLRRKAPDDSVTVLATGVSTPRGILREANGDLLIASYGANAIQRLSGGVLSTVATGLVNPFGLARDGGGDLYVTEYGGGSIARLDAAGAIVSRVRNTLYYPSKLRQDAAGRTFVQNSGSVTVRDASGSRVLINGSYTDFTPDGAGGFIALSGYGVYAISAAGVQTQVTSLPFYPYGLARLPGGDVLITDYSNQKIVRLSGTTLTDYAAIPSDYPIEIVVDGAGVAYVRTAYSKMMKIPAGGGAATVFWQSSWFYSLSIAMDGRPIVLTYSGTDGYHVAAIDAATGVASVVQTNTGYNGGIALDASNVLTVAEYYAYRLVDYAGGVVVGGIDGFLNPRDLIWTGSDFRFVDGTYLYSYAPGGVPVRLGALNGDYLAYRGTTLLAAGGGNLQRWNGTTGVGFNMIPSSSDLRGVVARPDGWLYVSVGNDNRIAVIDAADTLVTQLGGLNAPEGLAFAANGDLYAGSAGNATVLRFRAGSTAPEYVARSVHSLRDLAFAADGQLWATRGTTVSRIDTTTGVVTDVATDYSSWMNGIAFDGTRLVVADSGLDQVRELTGNTFVARASGLSAPVSVRVTAVGAIDVLSRNNSALLRYDDGALSVRATRLTAPWSMWPRADGSTIVVGDSGTAYSIADDGEVSDLRVAALIANRPLYGVAGRGSDVVLFDHDGYGAMYEVSVSQAEPPPPVGTVVHTIVRSAAAFPVGDGPLDLDFGEWTPPYGGDFRAQVTRVDASGAPTNFLHVGPFATAILSATTPEVPPGDRTVPLKLTLNGADFTSISRVETAAFRRLVNISFPKGMTSDRAGNVYFTDTNVIRKVTPSGTVSDFATGVQPLFGIAADSAENLYIPNYNAGQYELLRFTPAGVRSVVASLGTTPVNGVAVNSADQVLVGRTNALLRVEPATGVVTVVTTTGLPSPLGVAVDGRDNVYVQNQNHMVAQILPDGRARTIFSRADGIDEPYFEGDGYPTITADCADNFYITAYQWNLVGQYGEEHVLSQVVPRTGSVVGLIDTLRVDPSVGDIDYLSFDRFNNRILMWDHNTSAIYQVPVTCGAIGVEAHLRTRPGQTLSGFDIAPAATVPLADGGTEYVWSLRDVTAGGIEISMETLLSGLGLGERRPAIASGYIAFANSFVPGDIRLPIHVPEIVARNLVGIDVDTDAPEYAANETAQIDTTLANANATAVTGTVVVAVHDAAGQFVAEVSRGPMTIAAGDSTVAHATFAIGTMPAGGYEVRATLTDADGEQARAATPFTVLADNAAASATSTLQLDRARYAPNDRVRITAQAVSASANTLQRELLLTVVVRDPSATVMSTTLHHVDQLLPLATRTFESQQTLAGALPGTYTVTLTLTDAQAREFDSHVASFVVQSSDESGQGLVGGIVAQPASGDVGTPVMLTATVRNTGNADLVDLPLSLVVLDVDAGTQAFRYDATRSIARDAEAELAQAWTTTGVAGGTYTAAIVAHLAGGDVTLASTPVTLVQTSGGVAVAHGLREQTGVLMLISCNVLDATFMDGFEFDDRLFTHGFEGDEVRCDPPSRRAFMQRYLGELGFVAEVTDEPGTFSLLRDSGRYPIHWISGYKQGLDASVRRYARESAFRGEGLILDADPGPIDATLDEAAGLMLGQQLSPMVRKLVVPQGPLYDAMQFAVKGAALGFTDHGAAVHARLEPDGTGAAAIATHDYGYGTTATFTFDLVDTLMSNVDPAIQASLVSRAIGHVAAPARTSWHAYDLVPLTTTVTATTAVDLDVVVDAPAGLAIERHAPAATEATAQRVRWRVHLEPGESRDFDADVRIGDETGAYEIATRVNRVGESGVLAQPTLRVETVNRYDHGARTLALVRALAPTTGDDAQHRDAAVASVQRGLTALAQDDFDDAEAAFLDAGDALEAITTASVTPARAAIGELLRIASYLRWRASEE